MSPVGVYWHSWCVYSSVCPGTVGDGGQGLPEYEGEGEGALSLVSLC